jgi:hypothetical protein
MLHFSAKIVEILIKGEGCTKIKIMRQMMKKSICVLFLFICSFSHIYAANSKNITLNVQGTGQPGFVEGFKAALIIEAQAAGYQITENLNAAKYSIRFTVEFDQMEQKSKFIVSLIKVVDLSVIVSMEYFFADEEEMLLYSQLIFFLLMSNIPEDEISAAPEDDTWRNKWLYISPSFNYSLMFLALQSEGLIEGIGVYNGDFDSPDRVAPLDNKIVPIMGVGLGLEVQFLDFMSIEPHAQISMEQIILNRIMYSALFSVELKFPLKFFRSFVIEPYAVAAYSMRFPEELEIFVNYPQFIFGGGIQVAVKAGKSGALFFDVSYLYLGDIGMNNQYDELYPKPEIIYYNHSVLGFGIGYKFGLFDRKR